MTTAMTDTFPNLAFSSDPASGTLHGAPTMPFGVLAWSEAEPAEPAVQLEAAPVLTVRKPRIGRVSLAAMLFGGVTVVAAFGAIMLGDNDSPSMPLTVADHTQSASYVPPASAPMPVASHVAEPAPVASVVTVPVVVPPKAVAPAQPVAVPPAADTPKPTPQRPHWYWLRRILQQHQDQKR